MNKDKPHIRLSTLHKGVWLAYRNRLYSDHGAPPLARHDDIAKLFACLAKYHNPIESVTCQKF